MIRYSRVGAFTFQMRLLAGPGHAASLFRSEQVFRATCSDPARFGGAICQNLRRQRRLLFLSQTLVNPQVDAVHIIWLSLDVSRVSRKDLRRVLETIKPTFAGSSSRPVKTGHIPEQAGGNRAQFYRLANSLLDAVWPNSLREVFAQRARLISFPVMCWNSAGICCTVRMNVGGRGEDDGGAGLFRLEWISALGFKQPTHLRPLGSMPTMTLQLVLLQAQQAGEYGESDTHGLGVPAIAFYCQPVGAAEGDWSRDIRRLR